LGNDAAVNLQDREFVCRTKETLKGYSITIDFPEIKQFIENSIVVKELKPKVIKEKVKSTAEDIARALGI